MIKRVNEVSPIEMGIYPEHLTEDHLANFHEIIGKATPFAYPVPVAWAGQLRKWRGGDRGVVRERDAIRVGRKDGHIINLARNPTLHKSDVFICR